MKIPAIEFNPGTVLQLGVTVILSFAVWIAYCDWRESCVTLQETQAWVDELRAEQIATNPNQD